VIEMSMSSLITDDTVVVLISFSSIFWNNTPEKLSEVQIES
jgi:hypothetical protein